MNDKQKAKAYDEALERAKKYSIDDAYASQGTLIKFIFPELAESEDEKIINQLITLVNSTGEVVLIPTNKKELVDWLEKQKELPFVKDVMLGYPGLYFYDGERMHFQGNPAMEENPYDFAINQQEEKQKEQQPAEWSEELDIDTLREWSMRYAPDIREAIESTAYHFFDIGLRRAAEMYDDIEYKRQRAEEEVPKDLEEAAENYRRESCNTALKPHIDGPMPEYGGSIKGAFIAGAEWQASQKPAEWSEEDEKLLDFWLDVIDRNDWRMDENFCKASREFINRLKSLRPQPKEDIDAIAKREYERGKRDGYWEGYKKAQEDHNNSVAFHYDYPTSPSIKRSCYEGGPCTNPQMDCINCPRKSTGGMLNTASSSGDPTLKAEWKPSEVQMRGLAHAINLDVYDAQRYKLDTLYNDLKKLM